jgi:threonine synthase
MIDEAARTGSRRFVISSSGNAALSAIICVQNRNKSKPADPYSLEIFIGEKIDPKKYAKLKAAIQDQKITLTQVPNPKQQSFERSKVEGNFLLRQATSEIALRGYMDLAMELAKIENLSAVFVPSSSGTTAEGLALGFQKLGLNPQIHVVQTQSCHPLVDAITGTITPANQEASLASAIVDTVGLRKEKLSELVKSSGGTGWIITNEQITEASALVKKSKDLTISPNSALSVAALAQAIKNHQTFTGPVVCLITGD